MNNILWEVVSPVQETMVNLKCSIGILKKMGSNGAETAGKVNACNLC
ncbi:hypothetical protein [uncultured Parabacteroides sp.]|nr:hypothetical protein [uncultured Parabacteroides sp.]